MNRFKLIEKMQTAAPSYCFVEDDGATFKCVDCEEEYQSSWMIYYVLPNGEKGMSCKGCIEPDWKANAIFFTHTL